MFVAEQKKRENIAEYLLYMWQLEDILRAYELDIDKVQAALIDTTHHSDEKKLEARQWYMNLIEQMQAEGVEKEGHLYTNGGRVLCIIGNGKTFEEAQNDAYTKVKNIKCENLFYRQDIGNQFLKI